MIPDGQPTSDDKLYKTLYEAGTRIQHICYFPDHLDIVRQIIDKAGLPEDDIWCLFTIGHYSGRVSKPELIETFLEKLKSLKLSPEWAICAFAEQEQICLQKAVSLGGKVRVGFENSLFMPNETIVENNTERVTAARHFLNPKLNNCVSGLTRFMDRQTIILCIGLVALWAGANRIGRALGLNLSLK